ncbi:pyruvate, phosphate dikinase [Pelagicoccus mobilis]|uniref:Pyruvate, phosphate dikinase n=2 Tax=Pelagicoccus mobilis TaxID=415221 RepID=A0A934RRI7_9BACT|nr:pyruvate, phosphate dikinase [Pelagicoccus mobilis]
MHTRHGPIAVDEKARWVWAFDEVEAVYKKLDGDKERVLTLLGGKGANLAEIARIGLLIPPGFTVTTEACMHFLKTDKKLSQDMWNQIEEGILHLEERTEKELGNPENPLLVSCRSGARYSMPGMMDTVLNIGLNDETVEGLSKATGDPRFAFDCYRRLIQMYATVVRGLDDEPFEATLSQRRKKGGNEADFSAADWRLITDQFKSIYRSATGEDFPHDPLIQIRSAVEAVFSSWNGKRAIDYRNATHIEHHLGTACNVVAMVFGNLGQNSATGVAFTRNPSTGEKKIFGEYLTNAQGEDVVAGTRNAKPIERLATEMPACYQDFLKACAKLEEHFTDMQDLEFTIENGKFWLLQTRNGKRTPEASVRIAVDLANAGAIKRREAVLHVEPQQIDALLHPRFHHKSKRRALEEKRLLARGINASPGAAVGKIAFDADLAEEWGSKQGLDVIMVRPFTRPDDVHGMLASRGIVTCEGGATSHAAVVARQFGVPCIVGASQIEIDLENRCLTSQRTRITEGELVSIDGTTGEVISGSLPTIETQLDEHRYLKQLLDWADSYRSLEIRANADTPHDAKIARRYGASGIGLCRTEHMFFDPERLPHVQRMILTESKAERDDALRTLLEFQRKDFEGLFQSMDGLPVVFRLIDPPLHEFLPDRQSLADEIFDLRVLGRSDELSSKEKLLKQIEHHHESNPMMGLRGVRLSLLHPEIIRMQVRAMLEAAVNAKRKGIHARPEIMIPLTSHLEEFRAAKEIIEGVARECCEQSGVSVDYTIGSMIEIPRACTIAGGLALESAFFSFGTNDLTQMTFGFSRDDAERTFLPHYLDHGILPTNPFQSLDTEGVGSLIHLAVDEIRAATDGLEIGVCGEHGGDPASIEFFHQQGFNYVSCSPYRVPIARLAAAHAALKLPEL